MTDKRRWSRSKQIRSERPPDPLTASCPRHKPRRTVIVGNGQPWCLVCSGCPHCGTRGQFVPDYEDTALLRDPIIVGGRAIRSDLVCLPCNQLVVAWSVWRRRMISWRRGIQARHEGYRHPEDRAA